MVKAEKITAAGLIALIFIIALFFGCSDKGKAAAQKDEAIPVRAVKIRLQDIDQTLDYVGDIRAREQAVIYPRVSGKVIEKLKEDGSNVKKDDIIAYIDRDEVGFKFEKAPVESPLAGIIGRFYADIGENVSPQSAIAVVVQMDRVEITLDVPEKYLPKISLGQAAQITVDAYPDEKFTGRVSKISPIVDVDTRTAPVEIIIDNPGHRLKSGMFAKVSLVIEQKKSVPVILKEAVLGKEPNLYVYLINGNKAASKDIKLGIRHGPYYEVREGLQDGDLVAVMGQERLYDGAQVKAEEE